MRRSLLPYCLALAGITLGAQALASGYPIAGVAPYERPAGAPAIETAARSPQWYEQSLYGVSKPYPESLRFLENQGNWYTPFNRPGMLGPYDIRGWHAAKPTE